MRATLKILGWSALATLLLALLGLWGMRGLTGDFWASFALGKAGLTAEYCEHNHFEDFIRQPINTWSNLAYFFLGFWMLLQGLKDWRTKSRVNHLQRFPAMTIWMALMQMGLCFGSFFFHASVTRLGQHWDMAFTYGVALSLIFAGLSRWAVIWGMQEGPMLKRLAIAVAVLATLGMSVFKWRIDGKIALPGFMLIGLVMVVSVYFQNRDSWNGRLLLAGIITLVVAGVCRSLDLAKVACEPFGWLQFHALWHLSTGLSAFLFWAFLHREKP
jgi:uncharacterized membrane protein (UPF0136 family)